MISIEPVRGDVAQLLSEYVVEEIDDDLYGVTFDGRRLVVAAGARLVRLVPESGRAVDQLETFADRGGLAYDGRHIWQHSEGRLQKLDPRTGFVLLAVSPGLEGITGLECVDNDLLVLHAGGRALARVETFRIEALGPRTIANVELSAPLQGLAWMGRELWSSTGPELCRIDSASGQVLGRVPLPGIEACDLAGDGAGHIWCVDGRSKTVHALAQPARARSSSTAPA
jgi:hypothetical protein